MNISQESVFTAFRGRRRRRARCNYRVYYYVITRIPRVVQNSLTDVKWRAAAAVEDNLRAKIRAIDAGKSATAKWYVVSKKMFRAF